MEAAAALSIASFAEKTQLNKEPQYSSHQFPLPLLLVIRTKPDTEALNKIKMLKLSNTMTHNSILNAMSIF